MSCVYHLVIVGILPCFILGVSVGSLTGKSDCLLLRKVHSQSYKPSKVIPVSEWNSSRVEEDHTLPKQLWTLPVRAEHVRLDSSNWDRVTVYWAPGRLLYLNFFMLKVSEEREDTDPNMAYTTSYYVLVNVSDHKLKEGGLHELGYRCIAPHYNTVRLTVRVWALAGVTVRNQILKFQALDATLRQSNEVNTEFFKRKHQVNNCICETKVEAKIYGTMDRPSVFGKVHIRGNTSSVPFRVTLVCDGDVLKSVLNDPVAEICAGRKIFCVGDWNDVSISLQGNHVRHGVYVVKVELLCPTAAKTTCGRVQAGVVVSSKRRMPRKLYRMVSGHEDEKINTRQNKGPSKEPLHDDSNDLNVVMVTVLVTCSILAFVVGIAAGLTRLFLNFNTSVRHSKFCSHLRSQRVAILYTPEPDDRHGAMVSEFTQALSKSGLSATPIDEINRPGMMHNWIEDGESIVREFDELIFIVSPTMKNVCRRNLTPRSRTDDIRDIEAADADVLFNRLPAVVINSWKCQFLARDESQPRVHSIMLTPRSHENRSLAEEFCSENHSVFTKPTLHIAPSSNSEFQQNREFQKFISKIKRKKCIV